MPGRRALTAPRPLFCRVCLGPLGANTRSGLCARCRTTACVPCPDCGGRKLPRSVRCRACANRRKLAALRLPFRLGQRVGLRGWTAGVPVPLVGRFVGWRETAYGGYWAFAMAEGTLIYARAAELVALGD